MADDYSTEPAEGVGEYRPDLQEQPAQELVIASAVNAIGQPSATAVPVTLQPTQVRRPWTATIRTGVQVLLGLVTLLPFVALGVYESPDAYPAVVVQLLAVTATVARIMALPQVEAFLQRWGVLQWLAAGRGK